MGISTTDKPFPSLGDQCQNITWQIYNDPFCPFAVQILLPRITGTILHAIARIADCALSIILAMSCTTEAMYYKIRNPIYPIQNCQKITDDLFQRAIELFLLSLYYISDGFAGLIVNFISPQTYQEFFTEEVIAHPSPIPGFKNPGANCAFHSCLQVLLHHPEFRQVYEEVANYHAQIEEHKICGENMLAVLEAYDHAHSSKRPISADISHKMRIAINHLNPNIHTEQHHEDAHEILATLIEKYEKIVKERALENAPYEEPEQQLLSNSKVHFKNIITKHFAIGEEIQIPTSIPSSLHADNTLVKEEIQSQLKIVLDTNKNSLNFYELLQDFFSRKEEPISSNDSVKLMKEEKCFQATLTKEEQKFSQKPNHLIIQFARFIQTKEGLSKINTPINDIPEEMDASSLCITDNPSGTYALTSFITHQGGLGGGHYVAYIKKGKRWIKCDDYSTSYANKSAVLENLQKSYLCFYKLKTE